MEKKSVAGLWWELEGEEKYELLQREVVSWSQDLCVRERAHLIMVLI